MSTCISELSSNCLTMSTATREKKSKIRLPAFLLPSRKESKDSKTAPKHAGQSATLSRVSLSTMAVEGDIIFARRHSSNSDLSSLSNYSATFDTGDMTLSSNNSTTVLLNVDNYLTSSSNNSTTVLLNVDNYSASSSVQPTSTLNTTSSTPPSKPERKKRPAPSPTSRDQVSEVKVSDRSESMYVTDRVSDVSRDRPTITWLPDEHSPVSSCNSQGDGTNGTSVAIPPPRTKRQAPAPPPGGQHGTIGTKQHAVSPDRLHEADDVTKVIPRRDKPCKFEAPPPPATPPPISVDLSTQVYVTKRDSLTSECVSMDECSSLISDVSDDVTERLVPDQDHVAVAIFAKSMVSEMDDLTSRTHSNDVISPQPNEEQLSYNTMTSLLSDINAELQLFDALLDDDERRTVVTSQMADLTRATVTSPTETNDVTSLQCQEEQQHHKSLTSSLSDIHAEIELFNAMLDEDESNYSTHNKFVTSQTTEVGWQTSRVEPEGASGDEVNTDRVNFSKSLLEEISCLNKNENVSETNTKDLISHNNDNNNNSGQRHVETVIVNCATEQPNLSQPLQCVISQDNAYGTTVVYIRSERQDTVIKDDNNRCHDDDDVSSEDDQRIVFPLPKRKMISDEQKEEDSAESVMSMNSGLLSRASPSLIDTRDDVIMQSSDAISSVSSLRQLTSHDVRVTAKETESDAGEYHLTFPLPARITNENNGNHGDPADEDILTKVRNDVSHNGYDVDSLEFPLPKRLNGIVSSDQSPSAFDDVVVTSHLGDDSLSPRNDNEAEAFIADESFDDVIKHQVESFLDSFVPKKSEYMESSDDEKSEDYSSDDVIDSDVDPEPEEANIQRFYFDIKASCNSPDDVVQQTSSDNTTKHVISDVMDVNSDVIDVKCDVNFEMNSQVQRSKQEIHSHCAAGDVTKVIVTSASDAKSVKQKISPENTLNDVTRVTVTSDITAPSTTTLIVSQCASQCAVEEGSRLKESSRYHVTHDVTKVVMTSSGSDFSKPASIKSESSSIKFFNQQVDNDCTTLSEDCNSSDVTAMTSQQLTRSLATSVEMSQQRVAINDVTTRPRPRNRRSGLQFVQKPKQVILVELSTSSNTVSRDQECDVINECDLSSLAPSGEPSRKSSNISRLSQQDSSDVDIKDDHEEFSSKLMRLRANLKTNQVRQGSVSTRFTANGTELPRS